jgi:hypothetical protein
MSFLQARGRIGSADNESDNRQQNSAVDWIILRKPTLLMTILVLHF